MTTTAPVAGQELALRIRDLYAEIETLARAAEASREYDLGHVLRILSRALEDTSVVRRYLSLFNASIPTPDKGAVTNGRADDDGTDRDPNHRSTT
jgi:hypothetical protein